jgi:hypothetical protein
LRRSGAFSIAIRDAEPLRCESLAGCIGCSHECLQAPHQ